MKIRKTILKIVSLLLAVGLNYSGILGVGETMAYFSDEEISLNNTYKTGTLDFSLFSPHDNFIPYPKVENMKPGDTVSKMIEVHQEGSLPFKYAIRTEKISGDDDFCGALKLEARLEGEIKYPDSSGENSLMNFSFLPIEMIDPPGIDTWHFEISLPGNASENLQNKACEFKFVFEGWQDDVENYEENGFDDVEEIGSEISSPLWSENWIKVDYPDGGEIWYVGRNYYILWTTGLFDNCNGQLKIDLWYSADSGASWANIVENTKNDGNYNWRVPLFLYDEAGDMYFTASARARIKAVAACSSDSALTAWDMSDEDFCPPIDYDLLTPEEIEVLESLGLLNNSDSIEDDNIPEDFSGAGEELEFEDEINEDDKDVDIDIDIEEDIDNNEEIGNLELEISEEENINQAEDEETQKEEIEEIDETEEESISEIEIEEINNSNDGSEEVSDSADSFTQEDSDINNGEEGINEYETENSDDIENKNADKNKDKDKEDNTDAKDEKFVLTPKEEILPEDDDDINSNNNDFTRENGVSNNDNGAGNGLNKNSVDCVQAVK